MREGRKEGALFFVNLTNDVWFPRSLLPEQHFYHGSVRAAENGVPLIRSTNTGITGVIDPLGRPLKKLELKDQAGCLLIDIPLVCYPTIYTRLGDAFILSFSALVVFVFFLSNFASKIFFIYLKPSPKKSSI
jgi:apolipoprotein N-acyltransferase